MNANPQISAISRVRRQKCSSLNLIRLMVFSLVLAGCSDGDGDGNSSTSSSGDLSSSSQQSSSSSSSPSLVQLNELGATNTRFIDEEGDTPDWIELYNPNSTSISLSGWSLTDDQDEPDKWVFPDVSIAEQSHLLVWASDKDRNTLQNFRTLISAGAEYRYLTPEQPIDISWTESGFDDTDWGVGSSGFGFGDDDDATLLDEDSVSVFLRTDFTIESLADVTGLVLHMDYDDGFIAYINGVEIARANMEDDAFDALAQPDHEATLFQNNTIEAFVVDMSNNPLREGENTLAIQVHNASIGSSDLSAIPVLSVGFQTPSEVGVAPPDYTQLTDSQLHTNFKLSSSGETVYLFDSSGELVDSFEYGEVRQDISVGVSTQSGEHVFYAEPTPGETNVTREYLGALEDSIEFSDAGGVLAANTVTLTGTHTQGEIRYTLDGSIPHEDSLLYDGFIALETNSVVRAAVFHPDLLPSNTFSKVFLVNSEHDIPVVTLITDPLNLFDIEYGIYILGDEYEEERPHTGANFWEDWERPAKFSFYEADGTLGIEQDVGIKVFGGWSRLKPQKSLSVFAREEYGPKRLEYPLFKNLPYERFKSVVLRNSGNDWMFTMMRDIMMTSLMDGSGLDVQAYRSVALYINNEYWGLHNLREKVNEHYLAEKHDIDKDDIDLLETNGKVVEGSADEYLELVDYLENNSLESQENYDWVAEQIDVDNFMIYSIAQIYFGNNDWPGNNIKYWKSPDTKWRWILYDTDFGFGLYDREGYLEDTLAFATAVEDLNYANRLWATLLLRRLLENESYRHQFINRFADELNTRFNATRVSSHIDSVADGIRSEIPRHVDRWLVESGVDEEFYSWEGQVERLHTFALNRAESVREHIVQKFELDGTASLVLSEINLDQGSITVNGLAIDQADWSGVYFSGVPVSLQALPNEGYTFSHWLDSEDNMIQESDLSLDLLEDVLLRPIFVPAE